MGLELEFEGKRYECRETESVLECLLRHGLRVSSSCRHGVCKACLLKATSGSVPPPAQKGLDATEKEQGLFLACCCRPTETLGIVRGDAAPEYPSRVLRAEPLSARVTRIVLARPAGLEFRAGQFIHVERPDGVRRSYSIASLPGADELELHVARVEGGQLSPWLPRAVGAEVSIHGPFGACYYREDEPERPLVLAGTGTGLAPLVGVVRAAAQARHRAPVELFHGVTDLDGLYLREELAKLAATFPELRLTASVLNQECPSAEHAPFAPWRVASAALDRVLFSQYATLDEQRLYFSGNPELVHRLERRAYLAGAPLDRIHVDPFVTPGTPSA